MAGIVVVGSINLDLILECVRIPRPGETLPASSRSFAPGGKGANQATAAARLGAPVTMVGAVGEDAFALPALELLAGAGVDLDHVLRVPGATGIAVVYVDASGENSILIEGGANRALTAEAVGAAAALVESADVVVLQGEIPLDGIAEAAALTRGRLVVNLAPVVPVALEVLRRADPLVVNEHEGMEALRLFGEHAHGDHAVVAALVEAGVPSVVLTRGAQGALVGVPGSTESVPSPRWRWSTRRGRATPSWGPWPPDCWRATTSSRRPRSPRGSAPTPARAGEPNPLTPGRTPRCRAEPPSPGGRDTHLCHVNDA